MDERVRRLSRGDASAAVSGIGWRFVLGGLRTGVAVQSLAQAAEVTANVVGAAGPDAQEHLWVDLRPDRILLSLQTSAVSAVTARDVELARLISVVVGDLGLSTDAGAVPRSVQQLEIAIDAIDITSVRPFWRAVLDYAAEPGDEDPQGALVDPLRQGPAIWFQQMDLPRPQRNRIHLDISVPRDEAARRIEAALGAGGQLVSDRSAPAFWVLADAEGNEVCVSTWQGRD